MGVSLERILNPNLKRLYSIWQQAGSEGVLPPSTAVDRRVMYEWGAHLVIVDVIPTKDELCLVHRGVAITSAWELSRVVTEAVDVAAVTRKPILIEQLDRVLTRQAALLLPFAGLTDGVVRILLAIYPAAWQHGVDNTSR